MPPKTRAQTKNEGTTFVMDASGNIVTGKYNATTDEKGEVKVDPQTGERLTAHVRLARNAGMDEPILAGTAEHMPHGAHFDVRHHAASALVSHSLKMLCRPALVLQDPLRRMERKLSSPNPSTGRRLGSATWTNLTILRLTSSQGRSRVSSILGTL